MVPDDVEDIAQTVRTLSRRYDYVFTSGGIGPTHDDVTYEAIARGTRRNAVASGLCPTVANPDHRDRAEGWLRPIAFSRTLTYHAPTLAKMEAFFGERRQPVTEAAKRMALFPSGSEIVEVPPLWVPLVVCENVYIMPGIPQLFNAMVAALPSLLGQHGTIYRQLLYTRFFEGDARARDGEAWVGTAALMHGRAHAGARGCWRAGGPQSTLPTTCRRPPRRSPR